MAGLVIVVWLVYGGSLGNGFHYDDFHSIVENPHIRDLKNIGAFFHHPEMFSGMPERAMYRPLLLVTYALNYWVGGYSPWGYHLVNLGLHLACVLLVYGLGRKLGWGLRPAVLGAAFFALHPVQTETANYISSRSESLAALFYLLALLAYLHGRQVPRSGGWLGLSLGAYAGGLLSKSVALVLPIGLLLWEVELGARNRRGWWGYLAYAGVAGGYLLAGWEWLADSLSQPVRPLDEQLFTQLKALAYYGQVLAMPVKLSVDPPFGVSRSPASLAVLLPLLLFLSALGLLCWRRTRARLLLGWAILPLLPSSLMPLNVLVNEHRLYLPVAFLGIGAGRLWGSWTGRRRSAFLLMALMIGWGVLSHQRNAVWKDELSLWRDAVAKGPAMYRAHLHLGGALEKEGQIEEALDHYRQAAALAPEVVEVHYNLGNGLRLAGRPREAMAAYARSLALRPDYLPSLLNLASLHLEEGEVETAEILLQRASQKGSASAQYHLLVGLLRRRQGRLEEAEKAYRQALALEPDGAEGLYNLANLCFDTGRLQEAMGYYERAMAVRPDHAGTYRNLGDLYLRIGDFARAGETFSKGLQRLPAEGILYYGLGRAQEGLGQRRAAAASFRQFLQQVHLDPQTQASLRQRIEALEREEDP